MGSSGSPTIRNSIGRARFRTVPAASCGGVPADPAIRSVLRRRSPSSRRDYVETGVAASTTSRLRLPPPKALLAKRLRACAGLIDDLCHVQPTGATQAPHVLRGYSWSPPTVPATARGYDHPSESASVRSTTGYCLGWLCNRHWKGTNERLSDRFGRH